MDLVVSPPAADAIRERGGRLYVWPRRSRCCGGTTTLAAASAPPPEKDFRREAAAGFELYVPTDLARLPDELHIDARGRSRRIQAYWNGCAWVT
ncbi:MAG TPA: hypothetical protein VKO84_04370 [Gaiellaceae bacterium]|nr:hypothetical protein [Gaiellaceae bacterium]